MWFSSSRRAVSFPYTASCLAASPAFFAATLRRCRSTRAPRTTRHRPIPQAAAASSRTQTSTSKRPAYSPTTTWSFRGRMARCPLLRAPSRHRIRVQARRSSSVRHGRKTGRITMSRSTAHACRRFPSVAIAQTATGPKPSTTDPRRCSRSDRTGYYGRGLSYE